MAIIVLYVDNELEIFYTDSYSVFAQLLICLKEDSCCFTLYTDKSFYWLFNLYLLKLQPHLQILFGIRRSTS
jgi:hypothetical protein